MLLAGDVGATKTLLGLFDRAPARPRLLVAERFETLAYDNLPAMAAAFLARHGPPEPPEAACFGVAGPVRRQRAVLTNVPWAVDAAEIATHLQIGRVRLLNDLEAMAYAVPALAPEDWLALQPGDPAASGNAAVIAAGTGLGEAVLHDVDGRLVPLATEAGHADFAPRTPREFRLATTLVERYGRAQVEHVLSGPGLVNIHRFLHAEGCRAVSLDGDPAEWPARISAAALAGRCRACIETLELFVEAYGSEAGNLALRTVATGGVYVAGGIALAILPALASGRFVEAFRAKPPLGELLAAIPVRVIRLVDVGLLGAALYAQTALAP